MSKHPDHERIRDSSSETDSGARLLLPYLPVRSKWREASARFLIRHGASPLRAREPRPDGRDHHGTRRHRRTLTPRSRSRVRTQPRRGYPRPYWGRTRPRPRRGRSRGRARRSRGPHRSLGSRADVPAAVLGIARALGASHLLQRVHSGCLRLHSADVPRKRLDHAGSFGDHLRVRWRAVPLDGPDGTRETASRG